MKRFIKVITQRDSDGLIYFEDKQQALSAQSDAQREIAEFLKYADPGDVLTLVAGEMSNRRWDQLTEIVVPWPERNS